jgi:guanine deaminase
MLNVLGSAAAVSKLRGDDHRRWLSAREALQAGTLAGGRALGFGESLGSLRVGAIADIAAYRTDTVTFTPFNDPIRQLVYAERGAGLDFSMVGGEVVINRGQFARIDEAAILAEINSEFRELAERYTEAEASVAPILAAVERIHQQGLKTAIPTDTYPARIA